MALSEAETEYERSGKMIDRSSIFPLGIGTWKIDKDHFDADLEALLTSVSGGQNYLSLYMLYENGEIVRQTRKFVDVAGRDNLFINTNLEGKISSTADVEKQLDEYLDILGISYVDSLEVHHPWFSEIPLTEVYGAIKDLVSKGKVRYIGISNAGIDLVKQLHQEIGLDFCEGLYNLEGKRCEDVGILNYCREQDIRFFCFQPLRRNRTAGRNYPLLLELSQKYQKTQNRVILNWILKEKKIGAIVKSTSKERIQENLASLAFTMEPKDYKKLNGFRAPEFDAVEIDWSGKGGITIDQLANRFA